MTTATASTGVLLSGPSLPVETCARRLRAFGTWDARADTGDSPGHREIAMWLGRGSEDELRATISWHGPSGISPRRPANEATIQAMCGLMEIHGRDGAGPRRLALDVASVASGVLAAQAVLAALVARSRGQPVTAVETSVLEAGFVVTSHYIAAATSSQRGEWLPAQGGPDPGPPFQTVDGRWLELETFDPEAWRRFWFRLGAEDADLGHAWTSFRGRYFRGRCTLPTGLHAATARHTLDDLAATAAACGVSLTPVRTPAEVLCDPGALGGHPVLEDSPGTSTDRPSAVCGPSARRPLEGIEVVEATNRMQGPLAGLLLEMLGAHVVRVEPPGGDPIRLVPPYAGPNGSFFTCFNRGKDSVELDLTAPAGRASALELATGADVFLQNWAPGKAAAWGLHAEAMWERNPRLTYVHGSGWGNVAPSSRPLGTDFLVQAYAGLGYTLNPADEAPAPSRILLTDCLGALVTCEGALAGLLRGEQTGRGCRVHGSLLAGAMTLQAPVLDALATRPERSLTGGRRRWGRLDRPVPTADGYIAVDATEEAHFKALCRLCDIDPGRASPTRTEATIASTIGHRPSADWEAILCDEGIPCAPVRTDLANLPQDRRLAPLFDPLPGGCRVPAAPWRLE